MKHLIIITFLLGLSQTAFSAGDDIIKTWRDKQEAYFKGEALVQSNSEKAVEKLSKLLKKYKWDKTEEAKLMHKLAELHLSIGRVNETQKYIKTDSHTKKALSLFKEIINKHSNYKKLEYILFSYGFELFMRGRHSEAYSTLTKLNTRFPRSEFTTDAFVIRADSKFELREYKKSINLYQKAIVSNNKELAAYSSYRKAWAQFNANRFNSAYKSLTNVINGNLNVDKRIIDPKKEAQNDIARFYQKQRNFFNPYSDIKKLVKKENLEKSLSELAKLYFEAGEWKKAIHVYNDLIIRFERSKDISTYHIKKGIALSTRKNILKAGQEISSGLSKCKTIECQTIANDEIFKMVNNWEKHWRKHQSNKNYLKALSIVYPKLADVAVSNVEKSKIYLLLAEIEVFSKKFTSASIAYEKAYLNNKKASYANEAFWESINSISKLRVLSFKKEKIKRIEGLVSSYIYKFPSSKRAIDAQNLLAKVYIASNKPDSATDLYKSLSHKYLYKKTGLHAYNQYLKNKVKERDYRGITNYLLSLKKMDKKKTRWRIINTDLDQSYEDWSQLSIKSKKYPTSIKVLKEAIKNRPLSKLTSEWHWNLAYTYLISKKYSSSAESFVAYENKYKNSKKKQVQALNNAFIGYKKSKNYKKAIPVTDKLIFRDRKNKDNWLIEKSDLLKLRSKYIDSFRVLSIVNSKHPRKNTLFLDLISRFKKKQVDIALKSNLSSFTNESVAELVLKLIATIDDIDNKSTKTAAVSLINIKSKNKNYAAKGHYFVGMHEMRKFSSKKYTINSKLEKSLNRMIPRIMSVDESFRNSIQFSTDETQAKALIAMGNLYTLVAKKYQPYSKKLLKNKISMMHVKDLVSPFFDQSRTYWREAKRSISSIRNKNQRKKLERLFKKVKKSSVALESWYNKNSKIQFITSNGVQNATY